MAVLNRPLFPLKLGLVNRLVMEVSEALFFEVRHCKYFCFDLSKSNVKSNGLSFVALH